VKFLGFYPETVVARVRSSSALARAPTLNESLGLGAGGFAAAGCVVFAAVAAGHDRLQNNLGEIGANACWAGLFILLGGGLLSRLVIGPRRLVRFYILFAIAFLLYGAGWTAVYFPLRSELGEWLGSLLGATMLGLTLATAFDAARQAPKIITVLFLTRSAGYFCGVFVHRAVPGIGGWMLWGIAYGLGLGAGLGYALYTCQAPVRARLKTIAQTGATAYR